MNEWIETAIFPSIMSPENLCISNIQGSFLSINQGSLMSINKVIYACMIKS